MINKIPIFIGFDERERVAMNVLIDSLYQNSTSPIAITPIISSQLEEIGIHKRKREEKQSTSFSFTRFLVPYLMNYMDWAIFIDCDVLCRSDITKLWKLRDSSYALMCVKHEHKPTEEFKFLGEKQSSYPKKNWSSLMLMNCEKCKALTPDYVNNASGLDLHRFNWLSGDHEIGEIKEDWNYLVGVQSKEKSKTASMLHWTLGGPWFPDQRTIGGELAAEWYAARDDAFKLWQK